MSLRTWLARRNEDRLAASSAEIRRLPGLDTCVAFDCDETLENTDGLYCRSCSSALRRTW